MARFTLVFGLLVTLATAVMACGSDEPEKNPNFMTGSGGAGGGGSGGGTYDCVMEPTTHLEIINACTDAVRIEKHPELPPLPQQ